MSKPKAALLAVRERVEGLNTWPRVPWFARDAHLKDGTPVNPTEYRVVVDRAAVLAIIDEELGR